MINIYLGIMLKHFTTIHSLPWSNFLSQKEIYFTLHCRWRWQPLEVCSLNTDRIHSQPSCCWTHGFYEIVVNVFTNALKLYDFFIFIILFTWIYLSCLKKSFFVSRMARRVKQEINESNESQIGMDSLIPNGTVFEMYFVTLS